METFPYLQITLNYCVFQQSVFPFLFVCLKEHDRYPLAHDVSTLRIDKLDSHLSNYSKRFVFTKDGTVIGMKLLCVPYLPMEVPYDRMPILRVHLFSSGAGQDEVCFTLLYSIGQIGKKLDIILQILISFFHLFKKVTVPFGFV